MDLIKEEFSDVSGDFSLFVHDIIALYHGNIDVTKILCAVLLENNKREVLKLQEKMDYNNLLVLVVLIDRSTCNTKIELIVSLIKLSIVNTIFEYALLKSDYKYFDKFIHCYGITPWDCYLTYACKQNNDILVKAFIENGAQLCNNCLNVRHLNNIMDVYVKTAVFILKCSKDKKSSIHDPVVACLIIDEVKVNNIKPLDSISCCRSINKRNRIVRS